MSAKDFRGQLTLWPQLHAKALGVSIGFVACLVLHERLIRICGSHPDVETILASDVRCVGCKELLLGQDLWRQQDRVDREAFDG